MSKLDTTFLRMNSMPADNIRLNVILKYGQLWFIKVLGFQ